MDVTVKGPSTDAIRSTVTKVENKMKSIKGVADVNSDLSQTYDQYEIKVDQNKATDKGISAAQLALNLNENLPEKTITTVKENGNNIDGDYATTISGKITASDVGGTSSKVMREINTIDKPNNVKFNVGGATDDINTAMSQLAFAMLIAIVIVYLVLVITFKGGLAPFTILFSLPFTAIGIVFALLITGETISVPSLIGMLMLIGIVVTNAIVLIDRVISNEQQGMLMKEALIEAGGTRIRPILMTAVATIGALLPLLFGQNSSILISKGMAATVIGGLVSSTLLTLIVVPVIYEILFTLKNKLTRK